MFSHNNISDNANGGTEILMRGMEQYINPELLDKFYITFSRYRGSDPEKKGRIELYHLNDLAEDPETNHLASGGWNKFEKLVFVSNWQMHSYINKYGLPWYKAVVIKSAIDPFECTIDDKPKDVINIIYHTTPHRGLAILVPVFIKISEHFKNVHLDVFSSFEAYGLPEKDKDFKELFDLCKNHPNITYHGFKPNDVVREYLKKSHIFAYPCFWQETACKSLVEAMAASNICIYPNLAGLPEAGANWGVEYQWDNNPKDHAEIFYQRLFTSIAVLNNVFEKESVSYAGYKNRMLMQSAYFNTFFSWRQKLPEWENFLKSLLPRE